MSKRFRGILAAVLAVTMAGVLAWPAVMSAQLRQSGQPGYYYFFQVQNEYEEPFTTDAFVACSIYTREANNAIRSYTHSTAALANADAQAGPLYSNTNGIIHWYSASTNPVDVVCYTKAGDSGRKYGMTTREHRLRIVTSGSDKVIRFPFSLNAAPTGTGIYIPEGAVVSGVAIQVATPSNVTSHINVGFGGNHSVATRNALATEMGLKVGQFAVAHSASCTGAAANCAVDNQLGLALRHTSAAGGNASINTPRTYMVHVTGGLEVTYTTSNTAGIGGHGYVFYRLLHIGTSVNGAGY